MCFHHFVNIRRVCTDNVLKQIFPRQSSAPKGLYLEYITAETLARRSKHARAALLILRVILKIEAQHIRNDNTERGEDWPALFPAFSSKTSSLTSPAIADCLHDWRADGGRGGWIFFAWRKRGIGRGVSKRKGKRREMLLDVWVGQMEGEWWKTENDEKENKGTRWWNAGVAERCHFPPPVYSDRRLLGSHRVPLSLLPLTQTHTCSKNNIHTV